MEITPSLTSDLQAHLRQVLRAHGGWIGFDRFMALALYTPGLGYYTRDSSQIGSYPAPRNRAGGSDFVTAPTLSPLFGRALAAQVAQALQMTATRAVWEFGAGTGAMAAQLLKALGDKVDRYTIVDLSGTLQAQQRESLAAFGDKVVWVGQLPAAIHGVVLGNELIDAMPVKLLARVGGVWHERGVVLGPDGVPAWQDRLTGLRPPVDIAGDQDYLTEIHLQAEAFMRTMVDRLAQGALFLIDYGFPESEYYHEQRSMGTLMCHQAHRMDDQPLVDIGAKDITAHVNFTRLALAAQDAADATPQAAPWHLLGYTSQARFLINCGIGALLDAASLPERSMAQKLLLEHEMGELFKVMAFARGAPWDAIGFAVGDRSHTL